MDFRRLFDILPYQLSRYPQKITLAHQEDGKWLRFSTAECIEQINHVSAGLIDIGLNKGNKVGLLFESGSAYFNMLDFAMLQLGIIGVPIHSNILPNELVYILKDAEITVCITSSKELYKKLDQLKVQVVSLSKIFCLEPLENVPGWDDLLRFPTNKHKTILYTMKTAIHEDDIATIIYTSGSTGTPKGVMLSHKNIVSNIKATIALVPINCDKRAVSFLPLSHIFERMVLYTYLVAGASVFYVNRREQVLDVLKDVKPHYFTSVPKLLERMYDGILDRGETMGPLRRSILKWAIKLGERYKGKKKISFLYNFKLSVASLLVYRTWRKALGGRVEGVVVGAAALQPKLGRLFSAAGIEIREGYGLTETSPVIAFNRFEPGGVRFGTVGIPIPGIRLKINEPDEKGEGEILVQGPGVMQGYWNAPEETEKVMTEDGWFRTGDIGSIVHKRFLKITDRKKDIFKTSSGKYVAPQVLENRLNSSTFIEQCCIVGFNKPFVSALILPDFNRLKHWCEMNNVHWTAPQYMAINPKVLHFMEQQIHALTADFSTVEKVKKFTLLHEVWSVENGELTPTLKLKRPFVLKKYREVIEEMYS